MNIRSIKVAFFSPTGTSKKIVESVVRGLGHPSVEVIDITLPEARTSQLRTAADELLVVAVPVYGGRIPFLLPEWLSSIQAEKTPAVCLAIYGNRAVDDALLELHDILCSDGCVPVAGGVFIGEHSFSGADTPIAVSRPDAEDLLKAEEFGEKISMKLQEITSLEELARISFPGNHPYRELKRFAPGEFIAIDASCTRCGLCESQCPVHAIDLEKEILHDPEICIACCACIKFCPQNARSMQTGTVKDAAHRLATNCSERNEPVFYI